MDSIFYFLFGYIILIWLVLLYGNKIIAMYKFKQFHYWIITPILIFFIFLGLGLLGIFLVQRTKAFYKYPYAYYIFTVGAPIVYYMFWWIGKQEKKSKGTED